jgi:predicted DNA-binding transcriptional regulator AlpA
MQTDSIADKLDRHDVRQPASGSVRAADSGAPTAAASAAAVLLTDVQAAQCMGISRRKFHELRDESWMPRPIVLGPRIVRWSRAELEHAVANMPRQEQASEPAQLRRGRIDAMKRGGKP